MLKNLLAVIGLALLSLMPAPARSAGEAPSPPHQEWSFDGVFGVYNRAALQRGFQVYKEVCSVCHPVKHLYFRDLAEIGYTEDEVKALHELTGWALEGGHQLQGLSVLRISLEDIYLGLTQTQAVRRAEGSDAGRTVR